MTLVVRRMFGALAGFLYKHGSWPTKMIVPVRNWSEYVDNERQLPSYEDNETTRAVFARLELVPVPRQVYIAVDDAGRWFDYDSDEKKPENWRETVTNALWADESSIREAAAHGGMRRQASRVTRPIANSYVVPGTLLVAGEYPGSRPGTIEAEAKQKLAAFINAGVRVFIDLTDPADRLAPYAPALRQLAADRGIDIVHEQMSIRDVSICDPAHMRRVLGAIDAAVAEGRGVYVHCWGGVGRTGMAVGCWLVHKGRTGDDALRDVNMLFHSMPQAKVAGRRSPETEEQCSFVRGWAAHDSRPAPPSDERKSKANEEGTAVSRLDRYRGAMLGLAVGDALGTTLEFKAPGSFQPISDMVGGGPFGLKPGQWTDDTSMALCLAESLLECSGFDEADQMRRYVRWMDEGHWSSTGALFDVGITVRGAIDSFRASGNGFSGRTEENSAGNGSLMRLAPIPLFFGNEPKLAIQMAGESSRTTHGAAAAVDACRYFAALLLGALSGVPKSHLLAPGFSTVRDVLDREGLHPAVAAVAAGSFHSKAPPQIRGGHGYVVDTLEAALWAFETTNDFASGALAAVNLGGDADTTGAVYGQIAGAYYGASALPAPWVKRLAFGDDIRQFAERLFRASASSHCAR